MSKRSKKEALKQWEHEQILNADSFSACMYIGFSEPGRRSFDTRFAGTLDEARQHARVMLDEWRGKNYGRPVMIYAVTATRMSIHVENIYQQR